MALKFIICIKAKKKLGIYIKSYLKTLILTNTKYYHIFIKQARIVI